MERSTDSQALLPAPLRDKAVVVLGCGKVGSAIAVLLREAGLEIAAVTTRSAVSAAHAGALVGAEAGCDNAAAAVKGDIVFVTTNDDAIAQVAAEVADAGGFRPGQLVVHASGALGLEALAPAASAGATIGCAHPLQSFATAEEAARSMGGAVFGVTPGPGAAEALEALASVLGAGSVTIADSDKVLYHAAAVMASNYLVAVEDMAVHLLVEAGFEEATAFAALEPLVSGTVGNIQALGPESALTGPIVRGDVDTVRRHVSALAGLPGDELQLYRALGLHTLDIARRRNTLSAETLESLREVLAEDTGAGR